MKLENIGFYTLSDERAKQASSNSPLWRCEMILGGACNFKCPYCRGLKNPESMGESESLRILGEWIKGGLKNVRFSGGEPTLFSYLPKLVTMAKDGGVERIAISTNGSASPELYKNLLKCGVNDFSISLDACCAATGDTMSGVVGSYGNVIDNIRMLAKKTYVTVGIVSTESNRKELRDTIILAHSLGVSDIRIIPAAQDGKNMEVPDLPKELHSHYILNYRIERAGHCFRGLKETDNHRCPLALDDMAVANGDHYPCIIYLRERGNPIGKFTTINEVREEREKFSKEHDCFSDPICKKNCLDVCVAYNNRHKKFSDGEIQIK